MRIKENPVDFFMGQEHGRSMSKGGDRMWKGIQEDNSYGFLL
jgi:hypothetical protein